jgi:flagellar hook-associated protein 2
MSTINSLGIGSGLDIQGIVSQLVQAERAPAQNRINRGVQEAQSQISALGKLKNALSGLEGAMSSLADSSAFNGRDASSSDEDVFTASSTSQAVEGSYSVQVEKLAQAHRIASDPFASADTEVGTGTLSVSSGDVSFDVVIDSENNTLAQIRDAINDKANGEGVTASIINTSEGARLAVKSRETGAANEITISESGGDGGLSALTFDSADLAGSGMSETQAAQDAQIFLDGFEHNSADNQISDVLDGVTIDLVAAQPGELETLEVSLDKSAARDAIDNFVSKYNSFIQTVNTLTAYNPDTGEAGPLQGDSGARRIVSQLRSELNTSVETEADFSTLSGLGIITRQDGTLEIDDDSLDDALDNNFDAVGKLFGGENGVADRMEDLASEYVKFEGLIDSRTSSLENRLDNLQEQQARLDERMGRVEERYTAEFTAMDKLVSQLQSQGNFLQQQLAKLPTPSG